MTNGGRGESSSSSQEAISARILSVTRDVCVLHAHVFCICIILVFFQYSQDSSKMTVVEWLHVIKTVFVYSPVLSSSFGDIPRVVPARPPDRAKCTALPVSARASPLASRRDPATHRDGLSVHLGSVTLRGEGRDWSNLSLHFGSQSTGRCRCFARWGGCCHCEDGTGTLNWTTYLCNEVPLLDFRFQLQLHWYCRHICYLAQHMLSTHNQQCIVWGAFSQIRIDPT